MMGTLIMLATFAFRLMITYLTLIFYSAIVGKCINKKI